MTPTTGQARKLTAAQAILLAGEELVSSGISEFSEWQLTVAAWSRDKPRFGLRGYHDQYPDHKRVMMEIMGQKPHNPIHMKLMEKTRPNHYRLTALGKQEAARLRSGAPKEATLPPKPAPAPAPAAPRSSSPREQLYDALAEYVFHKSFVAWKEDPEKPDTWAEAAGFLSAAAGKPADYGERLGQIDRLRREAMDHCDTHELDFLPPTGKVGSRRLSMLDLGRLGDFLQALKFRFESHLEPNGKKHALKS